MSSSSAEHHLNRVNCAKRRRNVVEPNIVHDARMSTMRGSRTISTLEAGLALEHAHVASFGASLVGPAAQRTLCDPVRDPGRCLAGPYIARVDLDFRSLLPRRRRHVD